jgi:hypothetical protein
MSWKRPVNPWSTHELATLEIPFLFQLSPNGTVLRDPQTGLPILDPEKSEEFFGLWREKTGYNYTDIISLNHALQLITGYYRSSSARKAAKEYLAYGITVFKRKASAPYYSPKVSPEISLLDFACGKRPKHQLKFGMRRLRDKDAERFLSQYAAGLIPRQFVRLANILARAKEAKHNQSRRQNLPGLSS